MSYFRGRWKTGRRGNRPYRTSSLMNFFGIHMENAAVDEITVENISLYSNSYNIVDFLPNLHIGRNHFLVISSTFGLLSARSRIHRRDQLVTCCEIPEYG